MGEEQKFYSKQQPCNACCSRSIVALKSGMNWVGHVAPTGEKYGARSV